MPVTFTFEGQDHAFELDPDAFLRATTWGRDDLRVYVLGVRRKRRMVPRLRSITDLM